MSDRQNAETLAAADLLAAAAIAAAEADERGMRHRADLADRLTREAALADALEDAARCISRDLATDDDWIDWTEEEP